MIGVRHAKRLRRVIEKESESLTDEVALEVKELFPLWKADTAYQVNDRLRYEDKLYRVVQAHTSQADWIPSELPALYTEVSIEEIPVWRQPTGVQDAYALGDKVKYPDASGLVYVSIVDANVWEPTVYGWEAVN